MTEEATSWSATKVIPVQVVTSASGRFRRSLETRWNLQCPDPQWLIFRWIILKNTLRRWNATILLTPKASPKTTAMSRKIPAFFVQNLKTKGKSKWICDFQKSYSWKTVDFSMWLLKQTIVLPYVTQQVEFNSSTTHRSFIDRFFLMVNEQAKTLATSAQPQ